MPCERIPGKKLFELICTCLVEHEPGRGIKKVVSAQRQDTFGHTLYSRVFFVPCSYHLRLTLPLQRTWYSNEANMVRIKCYV